ncbi:MAG: hypothetical protein AAF404_21225, partial [Pseudomonadota bacterium]
MRHQKEVTVLAASMLFLLPISCSENSASELHQQAELCIEEIGVIEPFSCLSGENIPVTLNGKRWQPGDPYSAECDVPSWLGGNNPSWCHPNARVGRLPGLDAHGKPDDDVQNVFICRHYSNTDDTDPCFEDVAIIQHRRSTGATCFFQHEPPEKPSNDFGCSAGTGPAPANKQYQRILTSRVPPPIETAEETHAHCEDCPTADEFWLTPKETAAINCNHCHGDGPFVHSPYITQVTVTDKNGRTEPLVYPTEPNNKYRFVGRDFTPKNGWDAPEYLSNLNACTSCHVVGTGAFNFRLVAFAVGHLKAPPADSMPEYCEVFYTPVSDYGASYPHSHWMPPGGTIDTSLAQWNKRYDESVKEL